MNPGVATASMRRLLGLGFVWSLLVILLVPGSAGGAANSAERQVAALTTVTIATLPLEPTALAFYAQGRGFFRQHGIDAKLLVVADPAQLVAALLSGDVQFASINVGGAAILKARDVPVRLVAAGATYRRAAPAAALVAASGERIVRARDLIGKRIAIDTQNTIAHIGLLKWLKGNGVSVRDVRLVELPFPQMLGPLRRGQVDAAVLPEPFLTLALQRGAKRVANILHAVCREDCLITAWLARRDVDSNFAARFRNAIQAAAVWANRARNDAASGAILARYAPIDKAVIARMTRTRFSTRLRPALAQSWIDAYAEFGVIPASFRAIDLVR